MTRSGLEKFIGSSLGDEGGKGTQVLQLDEIQAQAILDMRLQRLTGLEREKIVAEFRRSSRSSRGSRRSWAPRSSSCEIIVDELQLIRKQFGDERRTEIVAEASDIDIEDLIVEEDMVITVSRGGYIKRSPLSLYRAQRRGGKGRIGATTKEEDVVEHLFVASTHAYILAFTSTRPHALDQGLRHPAARPGDARKGDRQPPQPRTRTSGWSRWPRPRTSRRTAILVFATKNGLVKKTSLSAYSQRALAAGSSRSTSRRATSCSRCASPTARDQIFIGTRQGMGIRFPETDVRAMGRDTTGVIGVSLKKKDDVVVEMDVVERVRARCCRSPRRATASART